MTNFLFLKIDSEYLKICFSDILYFEAFNKYVRLVTVKKIYLISATMHHLEAALPAELFCRIHRSYIVSLEHTDKFDHDILYICDKKLPIGKQYKAGLTGRATTINN